MKAIPDFKADQLMSAVRKKDTTWAHMAQHELWIGLP